MNILNHISIKHRMLTAFLLIGAGAVTLTGIMNYVQSRSFIEKFSFRTLNSELETKKNHIISYMDLLKDEVGLIAGDHHSVDAIISFRRAVKELAASSERDEKILKNYYEKEYFPHLEKESGLKPHWRDYAPDSSAGIILQGRYIAQNPFPEGAKEQLKAPPSGDAYDRSHAMHHKRFDDYRKRFKLEDIYLIDAESGMVLYSVSKRPDFATNLISGPYRDGSLAKLHLIMEGAKDDKMVKMADFRFYYPNGHMPTAFLAAPVFNNGRFEGTVVISLKIDEINRVMTGNYNWREEGLGETGETYLIGDDYLMRSDSRSLIQTPGKFYESIEKAGHGKKVIEMIRNHKTSILLQSVTTGAAREALSGKSGIMTIRDYRNVEVLSAYAPIDMGDFRWAILSEVDKEEAFQDMKAMRNGVIKLGLATVIIVFLLAYLLARSISKPIMSLTKGAERLKEGKLKTDLPVDGSDEAARLTVTFNDMRKALDESRSRLVESEKMASLGGLVAGVAHEINTPLGVGITSISFLKEESEKLEKLFKENKMKRSELEELFSSISLASKRIEDNLGRAAGLVKSFKQVAVDQTADDERIFDLPEYINETVESLSPQLKKGGHSVEIEGDRELKIRSFPGAFSQIITNLVMNSLKHGFEGMESGRISIKIREEKKMVLLEYEDNGSGIEEIHIKNIFDPFYTTKRGTGDSTGLGLHIVYNIVTARLGGEIRCESGVNEGTTFRIKLPLKREE